MEKLIAFFDQEFIKVLIAALIGTGTALFVFYLTIKNQRKNDRKLGEEQNNQRLNNFSNLLKSAKKQIRSFEKALEQQINNFSKDELQFPPLAFNPDSSVRRLKTLMQDENYFFAFAKVHKKRIVDYNEIALLIDYSISQEKQVIAMTDRDFKAVLKLKREFSELIYSLFHYKIYSLTFKKDLLDENYINKLNKIYDEFYKKMKSNDDMNFYYSDFIKPVLEQVLNKNVSKEEILKLTLECKKAGILISGIKHQIQTHKAEMEYILNNYKTRSKIFYKAIEKLI